MPYSRQDLCVEPRATHYPRKWLLCSCYMGSATHPAHNATKSGASQPNLGMGSDGNSSQLRLQKAILAIFTPIDQIDRLQLWIKEKVKIMAQQL